ncbi:MAG: hypothetical protein HDR00_09105 [Lachnospiraceae bacterium]|nr:hypothetical protein [Lachnospiraceae bacterium]
MGENILKNIIMNSIKKNTIIFSYIFVCCILVFVIVGCGKLDTENIATGNAEDDMNHAEGLSENSLMTEELPFLVTDNRDSYETAYYKCASDFIADCGFEEDNPFWEYHTEEGNLQLVLYYDEVSKEGCGVRYYPEEENKMEEGFRFIGELSQEPQYSVMEAWVDLASRSRLSCKRSTGKTFVYEYEESWEESEEWFGGRPYDIEHFASKGILQSAEDGKPSSLVEIDWTYRNDETLQKKEYRHNPQVFGTYRSSAEYYYGDDKSEKLLYQKFKTDYGSGEVYYIYGEDEKEVVPEYYLHIDQNQGIFAELVSYGTEIPDADKLNLDEETILADYCYYEYPFCAVVDHIDDEENVVVHTFEKVGYDDEKLFTSTLDWIIVNPDTGIGININWWEERKDMITIRNEEKLLYHRFLDGQIEDADGETIPEFFYEYGPLDYAYVDLNDDDIQELLIYRRGIVMNILTVDCDEVCWVSPPFYSGATREMINENIEIIMVDESHVGRRQYSVYRLNDEKEPEDVIFFQVWFAEEVSGLEEDVYSQYIGGMENGTEEIITKEEFDALYEKYVQNELDIEWMEFEP